MKKYIAVAKTYFKSQLAWRVDTILSMLFTVARILFAYLLWKIIFSENETVGGFTFDMMLSYYIIGSFLAQIDMSGGISNEISTRIRNGTFSKYMVIPVSIERYFISMEIGVVVYNLMYALVAAIAWVFLFRIDFTLTGDAFVIVCAVLMIILGMYFMVLLNYFLGLLTLKFQDVGTFLMIKNNLVEFITGSIIPLVLLPEAVLTIMRFLPFYYVTYLPSMLLIGRNSDEAITGVLVLTGWCIFMKLVNRWTYQKYRIKFDAAGI